jgi:hypothetical protein
LALKLQCPGILTNVDAGGLISYGPDLPDMFRRAGGYVARILAGAKPADLPAERPARFDMVVNLRTAKALGITIPETISAKAMSASNSGPAMIELPGVIENGMPRKSGQRKPGTTRGSPRRSRTAKALRISRAVTGRKQSCLSDSTTVGLEKRFFVMPITSPQTLRA